MKCLCTLQKWWSGVKSQSLELWTVFLCGQQRRNYDCKVRPLHHNVRILCHATPETPWNWLKSLSFSTGWGSSPHYIKQYDFFSDGADVLPLISVTSCGLLGIYRDSWKIVRTKDIWKLKNLDKVAVTDEYLLRSMHAHIPEMPANMKTQMNTISLMYFSRNRFVEYMIINGNFIHL